MVKKTKVVGRGRVNPTKGKFLQKVFYLSKEQDQYLLNKSVQETGQANKKSEILRGIIDMAMETDPLYDDKGGEY